MLFGGDRFAKDEVDALLEQCAAEMESFERGEGSAGFDPTSVVVAQFTSSRFGEGYDPDEVDDYLDRVVVQLREYAAQAPAEVADAVDPTLTSSGVRGRTFSTRGAQGIDQGEVDAFIARCADALEAHESGGAPTLTAAEVRAARFTVVMLRPGYDADEVDEFLGDVFASLQAHEARTS